MRFLNRQSLKKVPCMKSLMFSLALALTVAGCAPAQMRLPQSLAAASEQIPFEHMNGWSRGHLVAGEYRADYERGLARAGLGVIKLTDGYTRFALGGPGISSTIEGRCGVRQASLVLKSVEITPAPMAFGCDLTAEGRPIPARFELQESRASMADNLNRYARRGEIALAGQVIQIRSVHHLQGTALPVAAPIGYVFEQDGQAIGALELNGKPVLRLPPATHLDRRRAMMVASVALATFWDPDVVDD
jgi:hypothetical protein